MQSRPAAGFLLHSQTAVRAPRTIRIPPLQSVYRRQNRELLHRTPSACKPSAERSPLRKRAQNALPNPACGAKTVAQKNALRYNKPYVRL